MAACLLVSGSATASKLKDQSGNDEPIGSRSILSPAKIAKRIAPDARVCLEGQECGEASAAAAEPVAAKKTPEEIFQASCFGCHGTGAAGAPKLGDKDAWAPRIAQGKETLYSHAMNGLNAMPPKGMCMDCSEDDLKAVVDYMVSKAQ